MVSSFVGVGSVLVVVRAVVVLVPVLVGTVVLGQVGDAGVVGAHQANLGGVIGAPADPGQVVAAQVGHASAHATALGAALGDHGLPNSVVKMPEASAQKSLWDVRKAGLNIMMSMKGDGKMEGRALYRAYEENQGRARESVLAAIQTAANKLNATAKARG